MMKSLEEEARDFCQKTDEEIGEYWSNDYDELPLQIERFVMESKWVQAEKIRAQIEVLQELLSADVNKINLQLIMLRLGIELKQLENEN